MFTVIGDNTCGKKGLVVADEENHIGQGHQTKNDHKENLAVLTQINAPNVHLNCSDGNGHHDQNNAGDEFVRPDKTRVLNDAVDQNTDPHNHHNVLADAAADNLLTLVVFLT